MIYKLIYIWSVIKPDHHTRQLMLWTTVIGAVTFLIFWWVMASNMLPDALMPKSLTQENTGLFEALGGWALGFAGALVAIKIAGLATNIQRNDSIREQEEVFSKRVEEVSDYNSQITRAIFDAKRACHAVLVFAQENTYYPSHRHLKYPHLFNSDNDVSKEKEKEKEKEKKQAFKEVEKGVNDNLIEKIDELITVLEKASRDSTFREVLKFADEASKVKFADEASKVEFVEGKTDNGSPRLLKFFHSDKVATDVGKEFSKAIERDGVFFDFISALNESDNNFGIGLSHLRSQGVFKHYGRDIKYLVKLEEAGDIQFSEAAFLFLGILILQNQEVQDGSDNYNHGFVLLALIMGSLPNKHIVKSFLQKQVNQRHKNSNDEGVSILTESIERMADNVFYLDGAALSQLVELFKKVVADKPCYLKIKSNASGLSKHVTVTDDGDGFRETEGSGEKEKFKG